MQSEKDEDDALGSGSRHRRLLLSQSPKADHSNAGRLDFRNQRFETDRGQMRKMRKVPLTQKNERKMRTMQTRKHGKYGKCG